MKGLTDKQRAFVQEYLIDLNATQAAIRAGYSMKNADKIASQLLGKTRISQAIAEALERRAERTEITADMVLKQYKRLAFFDIRKLYDESGNLKPVNEWDDDTAAAVSGIETTAIQGRDDIPQVVRKVKLTDRRAALADIGKHLGMFTERPAVAPDDVAKQISAALREIDRVTVGAAPGE